jgi:hypothetical protein
MQIPHRTLPIRHITVGTRQPAQLHDFQLHADYLSEIKHLHSIFLEARRIQKPARKSPGINTLAKNPFPGNPDLSIT